MLRTGFLILAVAVACGTRVTTAGPPDAPGADAITVDVTAPDAAPVPDLPGAPDAAVDVGLGDHGACGEAPCGPTQLCFQTPSSGNDGECRIRQSFDGGVCPPGWRVRTDGCHGPNIGCVPPRCLPYPPSCGEVPPECQAHPGCGCFAVDPCGPAGTCAAVVAGHVTCACM